MSRAFDLLIVGAGPAGMSAATRARKLGLTVLVVDDQPAPGGQIWRAVERVAPTSTGALLGEQYRAGTSVTQSFRACGAVYEPDTQVWQIEPGWQVYLSRNQVAEVVQANNVILAIGAQERPAPFPGWTLPGVMTVGAAQILLKTSRQVPDHPVWIAGNGPLVLLYMSQLLESGGRIAGWLDTSPSEGIRRGLPHLMSALPAWKDLIKGWRWLRQIHDSGVEIVAGADRFSVTGVNHVESLHYAAPDGVTVTVPAELVLVHEGIVPSIHMTQAIGCNHSWRDAQQCLAPDVNEWGETSEAGIFVAGDGAGIAGVAAACASGEIAAIGAARRATAIDAPTAQREAAPLLRQRARALATRPMLDAMYLPRPSTFDPTDDTIVCRCEELTAADIRSAAVIGRPGPNQIKSFTRAGMGPCQGRQCGYTVAHILAKVQARPVAEVGFYRIRPPLKPLTLGELATLDVQETNA
jgi:NADPH-dependent 2,4-dienoyl-CoA reductase/sulfur reductase-like enzyme